MNILLSYRFAKNDNRTKQVVRQIQSMTIARRVAARHCRLPLARRVRCPYRLRKKTEAILDEFLIMLRKYHQRP
jgi:hypothetical protein